MTTKFSDKKTGFEKLQKVENFYCAFSYLFEVTLLVPPVVHFLL